MISRFIVFEGPEGSGKTTQIRRLASTLGSPGVEVVVTREPGGTAVGDAVRDILLHRDDEELHPETEALLLNAARAHHVRHVLRPALLRGATVLCDRYADSTRAYQGGPGGMSADALDALQRVATGGLLPDLRILLDLPVEAGLQRRRREAASVNRIDRASLAYHEAVRRAYLALATADPDGWAIIDAQRPEDVVAADVARAIHDRLGHRAPRVRLPWDLPSS